MTAPVTPYSKYLAGREPLAAMRDSVERIRTLTRGWTADRFERSYGPGKWSARQVLTHLAQTEMALGTRARMALATPDYAAQSWDQNDWMARESQTSGADALAAFLALARMNLVFFEGLSPADRATRLSHPEYGELTVEWIIHQMAGHQINHLQHLERIP
jgi:hypothetical protein